MLIVAGASRQPISARRLPVCEESMDIVAGGLGIAAAIVKNADRPKRFRSIQMRRATAGFAQEPIGSNPPGCCQPDRSSP